MRQLLRGLRRPEVRARVREGLAGSAAYAAFAPAERATALLVPGSAPATQRLIAPLAGRDPADPAACLCRVAQPYYGCAMWPDARYPTGWGPASPELEVWARSITTAAALLAAGDATAAPLVLAPHEVLAVRWAPRPDYTCWVRPDEVAALAQAVAHLLGAPTPERSQQ